MSVKVFSTKVLIEDTIFKTSTEYGTAILRGHSSHAKDQPLASGWNICWRIDLCHAESLNCQVRKVKLPLKCSVNFAFPSYFKTLSIGLVPGIESATSRCTAAVILSIVHSYCTH